MTDGGGIMISADNLMNIEHFPFFTPLLNNVVKTAHSSGLVKELIDKGIDKEKIVIGKPVGQGDATNTGTITASDLGIWAKRAK